ncbi:MAG TPA: PxKF domain-containing protein [Acidimicrobiales bacterium]|nr:PxKF domain-containing protein [Acidimicrobiales bacterium]
MAAVASGVPSPASALVVDDGSIESMSFTAATAAGPAGLSKLDKSTLDISTIPLFTSGPEAAPIRSTPIRSTPIRSTPIRSTPIRSTPIRSTPLATMPIRSTPLAAAALPPMPLSTVPVFVEGGWATLLEGTIYDGAALNAVTLQQALALDAPQITALTLNDIDIASTPIRSTTLQGFLFAGPTLDQLSSTYDWCANLPGFDCAANGINEATSTLLDLDLKGAPIHQLWFLPTLLVNQADLTASPLGFFDVGAMDVTGTDLANIPALELPDVVDCTVLTCGEGTTLADAIAALTPTRRTIVDPAPLSRVLARDDGGSLLPYLTFGDLATAVIDPTKLAYENLTLRNVTGAAPLPTLNDPGLVRYTAEANFNCWASAGMVFSVRLANGFTYVPDSATKQIDNGDEVSAGEPFGSSIESSNTDTVMVTQAAMIDTSILRWYMGEEADCSSEEMPRTESVKLSFLARPGVELGIKTASFHARSNSTSGATALSNAPFTVADALEPNDSVTNATAVTANTMYLSHIGDGDDVDYYTLPANLPEGTRIIATLSHLPADFDLFLDGPTATPFLASAPQKTLRQLPIEDFGPTDVAPPEGLQDLPIRSTPLSISDNRATETEVVSTIVRRQTSEPFTVTVGHHLGSNSAMPYLLQITLDPPPELTCAATFSMGTGGTTGTLPNKATLDPETKTIFLVNQKRMGDAYGATAATALATALEGLADRPEVNGLILPVDGDATVAAAYAAWDADRCAPEAANGVVRPITAVLDQYLTALKKAQYVVVVGDDDMIPFARELDNVSLSNQRDYYDSVRFPGGDNPISAASAYGMLLTDNAYTERDRVDYLTGQLLVPDLAGGRLVETPAEILGAIDQYTTKPYIDLSKTVTTGYDFVSDLATAITAQLTALGATAKTLNNETWTRDELLTALSDGATVASLNAHYDHADALPAQGNSSLATNPTLFSSTDLGTSGLDLGALLFTIGCNAGLNVPGRAWVSGATAADASRLDDFAQVVARDKRALGFLANTGFGYGDTAALAYGELFLKLFTKNLDGTMTVGQAVMKAREAFTREAALGVYDQKVVNESTFYGFPFAKVGANGGELPATVGATAGTALPVDPTLAVQAAPFDQDITLTPVSTPQGTYLTANGQSPTAVHYRPLEPSVGITLPPTPAGVVQGDVLITGLTSGPMDESVSPLISMPTSDRSAFNETVTARDAVFPVPVASTAPGGGVQLFPSQYRSEGSDGEGTRHTFSRITGKVLYPTTLNGPRPSFAAVEAAAIGESTTAFRIEARDADHVMVLYRADSATWQSLDLTALPATAGATARTWTGVVPTTGVGDFFVQGVRDGQVGTTRAKGLDFRPTTPASSGLTITVNGTQDNGWFTAPPTVTATGGQQVAYEASIDGDAFRPLGTGLTVAGPGLHTVDVRGSDGSTGRTVVAVDNAAPTVAITNPVQGQHVLGGNTEAAFSCADIGSGIESCTALDPVTLNTTAGNHDFRVKAVDRVGNETTVTVTYAGGYDFEGYFAPVENPGVWNVVQAGSSVPMKFRVEEPDGTVVTRTGVVTSSVSERIACAAGASSTIAPDLLDTTSPSGLRYSELDQQFVYTWKTAKAWADTCRRFVITLDDGSTHPALFHFKR